MAEDQSMVSIQTRLFVEPELDAVLFAFARRYGTDMRRLNRRLDAEDEPNALKRGFIKEGLTSRQFGSINIDLAGKRASRSETLKLEVEDKQLKIKALKKRLKGDKLTPFAAHQKRRRLAQLQVTVEQLQAAKPKIIFGGRKLWQAQHNLAANGYSSHEEWLTDWRAARSLEFFLVGSSDETRGNQSCQYDPIKRELKLRLPEGHVILKNVRFAHGQEIIDHAVFIKQAITYRFVRKPKGWYIYVATRRPSVKIVSNISRGAIGLDLGPKRISAVETDNKGNPIWRKTFSLDLPKKGTHQTKAILGMVAKEVVNRGVLVGKPLVVEDLDFSRKKADLREHGKSYARMLSGFAYTGMVAALKSRAARFGIQVFTRNPAFTSTIGIIKFAAMYGLSGDEAAALAIARRGQNLKESLPTRSAPARPEDRSGHVWKYWRQLGKALRLHGRHAFVAATRGSGRVRVYPDLSARASPTRKGKARSRAS